MLVAQIADEQDEREQRELLVGIERRGCTPA